MKGAFAPMRRNAFKKFLLLSAVSTLFVFILPLTALASDVAVDENNFPDVNFRNYVSTNLDSNADGTLSDEEISKVTYIYCDSLVNSSSETKISTLSGIEIFKNLRNLSCNYNEIESLDLSSFETLQSLSCAGNKLTSLDLSQNTALQTINCAGNGLTSLNLGNATCLEVLWCTSNELHSLDISKCTALKELYCHSNNIETLDVSNNLALTNLSCSWNQLTTLDVSKNTKLTSIGYGYNHLTFIDLSNNVSLTSLGSAAGNSINIPISDDNTCDLALLPVGFDVSKTSGWHGGTVEGMTLTVDPDTTEVWYYYDNGFDSNDAYTLKLKRYVTIEHTSFITSKSGKEVTIEIDITKNPGLASMQLELDYDDDLLDFVSVSNGDIFTDESFLPPDSNNTIKVLSWQNSELKENITATGNLATLKFKINDDAYKKLNFNELIGIKFICDCDEEDAIDIYGNSLLVQEFGTSIRVLDYLYGDVNDDDLIDISDVMQLRRYIAKWNNYSVNTSASDLDGNGKITLRDVTILERYLACWTGYEVLPMSTNSLPI